MNNAEKTSKNDLRKVTESSAGKEMRTSAKQALKKELKRTDYDEGQALLNPQPEGKKGGQPEGPSGKKHKGGSGDQSKPQPGGPTPKLDPMQDPTTEPDSKTSHSYGMLEPKYGKVQGAPFIKEEDDTDEITMDDVSQGRLGDCYLIASLGAIADKNPDAIRKMIKDNKNGSYTVTFHEGGSVVVDDQFPVDNGNPVYADVGDAGKEGKELWVMLIEKAWAKLKGGYEKIQGGQVRMTSQDAMEAITGNKTTTLRTATTSNEALLDSLTRAQENGLPITASTFGDKHYDEATLKKMETKGVHANHAYAVVKIDAKAGTIELYNPWGKETQKPLLDMTEFRQFYESVNLNAK